VDLGIHLPLMQFGDEELSRGRLEQAVDAARECGLAAVSANDHFVFSTPWLDGPTALASVIERTGDMTIATTVLLAVLRGPVPLAKTLAALDVLSEGRLVAALGPGSSKRDYETLGIPFEERWKRFAEAITVLRSLLEATPPPSEAHYYSVPADIELAPGPRNSRGIPLWIGSWGSDAGLRRVARIADGWLASAYNTTPERFAEACDRLARELEEHGREAHGLPNALATMWTWITKDRHEAGRVLHDVIAPLLNRAPGDLEDQLCIGPPEQCAALLSRYAKAGCQRVYLWPLGDERRQIELVASEVAPLIDSR
jgi:alkanesulfonate monooxygenase SsuD/methylene tetrahydromethanopterin reductase-like flavin-dependent oxidoreductase (luciferase family)